MVVRKMKKFADYNPGNPKPPNKLSDKQMHPPCPLVFCRQYEGRIKTPFESLDDPRTAGRAPEMIDEGLSTRDACTSSCQDNLQPSGILQRTTATGSSRRQTSCLSRPTTPTPTFCRSGAGEIMITNPSYFPITVPSREGNCDHDLGNQSATRREPAPIHCFDE